MTYLRQGWPIKTLDKILAEISEFDMPPSWMGATHRQEPWRLLRATSLTQGQILQVDVTVDVQYGAGRTARFTDQLLAGAMSQGGDSGSAVLDSSDRLVGLLFAGSPTSTVINRIEHVFSALRVSL